MQPIIGRASANSKMKLIILKSDGVEIKSTTMQGSWRKTLYTELIVLWLEQQGKSLFFFTWKALMCPLIIFFFPFSAASEVIKYHRELIKDLF